MGAPAAITDTELLSLGATAATLSEIRDYLANPYIGGSRTSLPLSDAPHIERWLLYESEAREMGSVVALRRRLVQLRFAVAAGISSSDAYRRATRRGELDAADEVAGQVELTQPERVQLQVLPTLAGRLPVLTIGHRDDFVTLVRALSGRNEPIAVPPSLGAAIVSGFNNWDRVYAHRGAWEKKRSTPATEADWQAEFRALIPNKALYQDTFVLLSSGFYSAVNPEEAGMSANEWRRASVAIRREHEFTHYFSLRLFGDMRNNLLDEVLADFAGMVKGLGYYDGGLAKRCLGVGPEEWGTTGRLDIYRGDPPIEGATLTVIKQLAVRAVDALNCWSDAHEPAKLHSVAFAEQMMTFFRMGLDGLAAWDGRRALGA